MQKRSFFVTGKTVRAMLAGNSATVRPYLLGHERSSSNAPWMNTTLLPDQRASLLAAQMTLDEKILSSMVGLAVCRRRTNPLAGIPALHLSDGPAGMADGIQA